MRSQHQLNFCLSFCLKIAGSKDSRASRPSTVIEVQEMASPEDVSWCNVVPAWMHTNDGGATPVKIKQSLNACVKQINMADIIYYRRRFQQRKAAEEHWLQVMWCWWTSLAGMELFSGIWYSLEGGPCAAEPATNPYHTFRGFKYLGNKCVICRNWEGVLTVRDHSAAFSGIYLLTNLLPTRYDKR